MGKDSLVKMKLSKAQKDVYEMHSQITVNYFDNDYMGKKGVPKNRSMKFHLKNKSITKFRIIICPDLSEAGSMDKDNPYWPVLVGIKECDIWDFLKVIDRVFPYKDDDKVWQYAWDGTTDILTKRLSND